MTIYWLYHFFDPLLLIHLFFFFFKLCQKLSTHVIIPAVNQTSPIPDRCYLIEQCNLTLTTNNHHYHLVNLKRNNHSVQLSFASKFQLLIDHDRYKKLILFTLLYNDRTVNTTDLSTKDCYSGKELVKSNTLQQAAHRSGRCTSVCTSSLNTLV